MKKYRLILMLLAAICLYTSVSAADYGAVTLDGIENFYGERMTFHFDAAKKEEDVSLNFAVTGEKKCTVVSLRPESELKLDGGWCNLSAYVMRDGAYYYIGPEHRVRSGVVNELFGVYRGEEETVDLLRVDFVRYDSEKGKKDNLKKKASTSINVDKDREAFRHKDGLIDSYYLLLGEISFTDVSESAAYAPAVRWAYQNGITTGTGAATFSPNDPCTRGQVATFLWRAKGEPQPQSAENPFQDVSKSSPFCSAILWAYENGITAGKTENLFDPAGTCSKAQILTFLWRAAGEPDAETAEIAEKAPGYARGAISWAAPFLDNPGAFQPNEPCTRADAVYYLWKTMGTAEPEAA